MTTPGLLLDCDAVRNRKHRRRAASPGTILCVPEDHTFPVTLETEITKRGYTLLRARHGMHGLWLAVTTTPDVIVSNVSHPERSSNYLLESLRRNPKTERIPIIALIPTITQRQAAVSCLRWATSTWLRSSNPTELAGEIERLIAAAERREAAVEWASIARRDAYFAQLGHEGVASPKLYTHSARKRRECHQ